MSQRTKILLGRDKPRGADQIVDRAPDGLGKPRSDRRPLHHSLFLDKLLILLIPAAFFYYRSSRPVIRLRVDMPSRFVDFSGSADPGLKAEEKRIALAYWNCGVTLIQWKYAYGSPLPTDPPMEFKINESAREAATLAHGKAKIPDSRTRYWNRFRELWVSPESWRSTREWSTAWLTGPVYRFAERCESYFTDLWKAE